MKILELGALPKYKTVCHTCKTIFEFDLNDVGITKTVAFGSYVLSEQPHVICPCCGVKSIFKNKAVLEEHRIEEEKDEK